MFETQRKILVDLLKKQGRIRTKKVENAFLETKRELFVPEHMKKHAYVDTPLEIGQGQTISAPHMVAIMCEELDIKPGQKILEIGAGSGYHAAIISRLIGEKGYLYTVERIPFLAEKAQKNLKKADVKNVTVIQADGSLGYPDHSPYDRIYVTCASPKIPEPLTKQLKDKGKMLIPVGRMISTLTLVEKTGDSFTSIDLGGCSFVPLIGEEGF